MENCQLIKDLKGEETKNMFEGYMKKHNIEVLERSMKMQEDDEVVAIYSNYPEPALRKMRHTKEYTEFLRPRVSVYDTDNKLVKLAMKTDLDEGDQELPAHMM